MNHSVVSEGEWLLARKELLVKEKEFSRLRDQLSAERRRLPWVKVVKPYVFDAPLGRESLADLFAGRSQLIVYHFMLAPGSDHRCTGCSFLADHIDGARVHLQHHDVSLVVCSRAPRSELEPFRQRMGWSFKWVSSFGSEFNIDYGVSFTGEGMADGRNTYNYQERTARTEGEAPGVSVFFKDEQGDIFHTYSSYGRGGEVLIGTYEYLDLTPQGRNENGPYHNLGDWVRLHDEYPNE
jgi:predicted dithiol-disulfide oxidoreductase (DUF899 family)